MSTHSLLLAVFGLFGMLGEGFGQVLGPDQPDQGGGVPANSYVAEDGSTPYVAEDGVTYYVTET